MPWSATISTDDVVAIHCALLPTANGDGQIILFGGDDHFINNAPPHSTNFDHARTFNCHDPSQPLQYVNSPPWDLFCCGHASLGDGRLLVAGGTADFPQDAGGIHAHIHFAGHRKSATFTESGMAFTPVSDMNTEPGANGAGGGRWYPTLCCLGTGEVLALEGHPADDDTRHSNSTPERYQPLADSWVLLPQLGAPPLNLVVYPRCHLLNDGNVFISSSIPNYNHNVKVNPFTGAAVELGNLPDAGYLGIDLPSVLLPLVPTDGYQAHILLCGKPPSQLFDFTNQVQGWQTVPRDVQMSNVTRIHACATLLPTGDVLLTGGADPSNDQNATGNDPELYHTPLDTLGKAYKPGVGSWETLNDPATVLRNYHSTALLMPDGRVWTAGGNGPGQPTAESTPVQREIEIFSPPYPAGTRPVISTCPHFVAYGQNFAMNVPAAGNIQSVVLMRCGSSTHAFNPDQRSVLLEFSHTNTTITATAPPNGNVAPPGNYMVWIVDMDGRPCDYAKFTRLGGSVSMFTCRNKISKHEVQALLTQTPPSDIPSSFYVVLDGFCANDLNNGDRPFPPNVQFHFADNNTVVPDLTARLTATLFESTTAASNITQRIALEFSLHFASEQAFNGIAAGNERQVRIDVAWGESVTSALMILFKKEHVYALKGPTPWLSIDVRVLRLPRGQSFATMTNNGPVSFVHNAIQNFRSNTSTTSHPFDQLSPDEAGNPLELSATVNNTEVDNFAFAKVRFRAPVGIKANDVKVFFRLFNTSVTNMLYDTNTIYPRIGNGANAVATIGSVNGNIASYPFFADARSSDPTKNFDPINVMSLTGDDSTEVSTYFGCWLDFNTNTTVRDAIIRGGHQCIVAEIHYVPSLIDPLASPMNDDNLSQRNLSIVQSDNPGSPAAHMVPLTFLLKPVLTPRTPEVVLRTLEEITRTPQVDELFIQWHDLPKDAYATIYLPTLDVTSLVAAASILRTGAGFISQLDANTVLFRIGDASYLPLLWKNTDPVPGLLTIQMPPTVRKREVYKVSVWQLSGAQKEVVGTFQVTIPVATAGEIVEGAGRELGVLKAINSSIKGTDLWKGVFKHWVGILIMGAMGGIVVMVVMKATDVMGITGTMGANVTVSVVKRRDEG